MTSVIEKRRSLHRCLENQQHQYSILKSQNLQMQALANIGSATCMIAHEINNLLTPLANYATLALDNLDDKSLTEKALQKTAQSCQRATRIMDSMLALANGRMEQKENALLVDLVEEIFDCLSRDFAKDGITVKIQIPGDLTVWAVPVQIQQVLMNLILNARDAMLSAGGVLTIKATEGSDVTNIKISDTGSGINRTDLKNIFDSFFTTKAEKNASSGCSGNGLGLAFCKKVIDSHSGIIIVESEPSQGTTFKITLPKSKSGNS